MGKLIKNGSVGSENGSGGGNVEIFKVNVTGNNYGVMGGKSVLSARQLHSFLGNKKHFDDWFDYYCDKFEFKENVDYVKIGLRDLKSTSNGLASKRGKFEKITITHSVIVKKQNKHDSMGFDYALTLSASLYLGSLFGKWKCAAFREWIVARQKEEVLEVIREKEERIKSAEHRLHEIGARLDAQEYRQMKEVKKIGRSYRSHPNWAEIHRQVEICCVEYGIGKKEAFDILYAEFGRIVGQLGLKALLYKSGRTDSHLQKIFDRGLSNRFLLMGIKDVVWSVVRCKLDVKGYAQNNIKTIGARGIKALDKKIVVNRNVWGPVMIGYDGKPTVVITKGVKKL